MRMPVFHKHICIELHFTKRTLSLLILLAVFLLFFWRSGMIAPAYAASLGLENLPTPFVSSNGFLNTSVVVASSVGHGPVGGAHTMDVMGAIMIAEKLGLKANCSMLDSTMDDYVSTYDFANAKVTLRDFSSNLVVVGGPGVNQITWYYNNLRNATGARVLPVYFDKDQNGVDYIYVRSSGKFYKIERDGFGRISADYGSIMIFQNGGRFVLILAGLGGYGTWASCKIISSFEDWNLHGSAAVVKYYDSNGDGFLDTLSIVDLVSGTQYVPPSLGYAAFGLVSIPLLPKWKVVKQKINWKRRLSNVYVLLFIIVASQIALVAVSSVPSTEAYSLKDFSQPFVSLGGLLNSTVVVASSVGHGPVGSAHTMDVMGAIMIGAQLGLDASGGDPSSALDDHVSSYDSRTAQVSFPPLKNNLLVVGGPGVNQITWHYNNLRNATGARVLPAYFDKDQNGVDIIQVASSGHSYRIEHDSFGGVKTDYGVITMYYDTQQGIWVLIIGGLGGSGTLAASRLLASYKNWSLFGRATVVRFADSNGDGYLDEISIAESVGFGKSIDVYWDAKCMNPVRSIDWGMLSPGETKSLIIYIRNEGESGTVLALNVYGWNPAVTSNYLKVVWNYSGTTVESGQLVAINLMLVVDSRVDGITDFSVTIDVDSS
jgi:hypothetical protein